jgi:hypothetical protein
MRVYYNVENDEYITEKELYKSFLEYKADPENCCDYDFRHYISNCMTANNGILQTITERIRHLEKIFKTLTEEQEEQEIIGKQLEVLRIIARNEQ